ncbi:MAG: DEAD/DEAH box helicase family protein, partial [Sphingomonas sp.]
MTPRPFQSATVDAALACLKAKGRRRFLVADEVGLGKTLVAREVVRRLSSNGTKAFTVFYITSNTRVSDQNAKRLVDFLGKAAPQAVSTVDRLGLIPIEEHAGQTLRLYPLAPITSFPSLTVRPQTGKAGERAFIAQLLERCYPGIGAMLPKGFMQQRAQAGWQKALDRAEPKTARVPRTFVDAYRTTLVREFGYDARKRIVKAANSGKPLHVLASLRRPLAEACLLATPPDLVIFDEFQRYRDLLAPTADDRLVRTLLGGKTGRGPAMLL